jgi:hypothetical protein
MMSITFNRIAQGAYGQNKCNLIGIARIMPYFLYIEKMKKE